MSGTNKPIILSGHAALQSLRRGATEEEIREAIKTSEWRNAELDKLECSKDFVFNKIWNGKLYKTKQVRPIFVEEAKKIVIVTVYVYYY